MIINHPGGFVDLPSQNDFMNTFVNRFSKHPDMGGKKVWNPDTVNK